MAHPHHDAAGSDDEAENMMFIGGAGAGAQAVNLGQVGGESGRSIAARSQRVAQYKSPTAELSLLQLLLHLAAAPGARGGSNAELLASMRANGTITRCAMVRARLLRVHCGASRPGHLRTTRQRRSRRTCSSSQ
jgi:uncharacterized ferredoxin-like protein